MLVCRYFQHQIIPLWDEDCLKMPLNLEFLCTVDVPTSSTQDWKYQSLTREECLKFFSFLLTKIVFFSFFFF